MRIERLRVSNFRKIRAAELEPGAAANVVFGSNGGGKTSLLEAIHLLSSGRSFRSRRVADVISEGEEQLNGFARVVTAGGVSSHIGVEKGKRKTRIRIDNEEVNQASGLARLLPTLFIGADCSRLLEEAERRRRLLDWVMFHVEPDYLQVFQRYQRVLRQRNAALRSLASAAVLDTWDQQLAELGWALHALRALNVPRVVAFAVEFLERLLPMTINIDYRPGWNVNEDLGVAFACQRSGDLRVGYTRIGPHRADLDLSVGKMSARAVLSRGESKLLAMGVVLAQAAYFLDCHGESPVLLIDDIGTELDGDNRKRFTDVLESLHAQSFITTVLRRGDLFFNSQSGQATSNRLFHVEQGEIRQVV